MKRFCLSALLALSTTAAWAHTPEHGEMSDHIEMVPGRAVTFMPMAGKLHVLTVVDGKDADAEASKPGEAQVLMTADPDVGTTISFTNGLDYAFSFDLESVSAEGERMTLAHLVCAAPANGHASSLLPAQHAKIVVSHYRTVDAGNCGAG